MKEKLQLKFNVVIGGAPGGDEGLMHSKYGWESFGQAYQHARDIKEASEAKGLEGLIWIEEIGVHAHPKGMDVMGND